MAEHTRPQGERVAYATAGAAGRAALARAAVARRDGLLRPFDRDVLGVLVGEIVLYSRLTDEIGTRRLAADVYGIDRDAVTGHQRRRVAASLRKLRDAKVIEIETGRGRNARTVVAFPAAEECTDEPPYDEERGRGRAPIDAKGGADESERGREPTTVSALKGARRVGHDEKRTREGFREESARPLAIQSSANANGNGDTTHGRMVEILSAAFGKKPGIEERELDADATTLLARGYDVEQIAELLPQCSYPSDLRRLTKPNGTNGRHPDDVPDAARRFAERRAIEQPLIDACDLCASDGWRTAPDGGVARCDHTTP